jgi:hypothetical protein
VDEGGSLDMDLETEDMSPGLDTPRTEGGKGKGRKSGMTDVSEVGVGRDGRSSMGRLSGLRKSIGRRAVEDDDEEGDESADLGGMSMGFEGDANGNDSIGMDTVGDVTLGDQEVGVEAEAEEDEDIQPAEDAVQEEEGNADEDVSLEAAAVADEEREDSEGAEDREETRPAEKKKKVAPKAKNTAVKRKAAATNGHTVDPYIVKKKTRLSRLPAGMCCSRAKWEAQLIRHAYSTCVLHYFTSLIFPGRHLIPLPTYPPRLSRTQKQKVTGIMVISKCADPIAVTWLL